MNPLGVSLREISDRESLLCYDGYMKYFVVRHGQTDANRMTRMAFGAEGAPINKTGKMQAQLLGLALREQGINPTADLVAVSELLRTRQTAEHAGFKRIVVNSLLNEINTSEPEKTLQLVAQARVPRKAIKAAEALLAQPPLERIWITHGLVIAALEVLLDISDKDSFVPDFCEIRILEF